MKVAWLADLGNADGTIGGAELTQAEFRAAAPKGVEVVEVQPVGPELARECDVVCVHNCVSYPAQTVRALMGKRVVKYWNDLAPHNAPDLRDWLLKNAVLVFCSPLHRERFPWAKYDDGEPATSRSVLIPPPVDLDPFRKASESAQERSGAVALGPWMNMGKAPHRAAEWAKGNGGIDFYGGGTFAPRDSAQLVYEDVPEVLVRYKTFVHLPIAVEPFGRTVVEAWAAGCELVVNKLVGARYWIEQEPEKLETAAEDFWELVCAT